MAPPQRSKNLRVAENVSSDQAALRNLIVTDDHSDEREYKFLRLLREKKELGILSQDDIDDLVVRDDPVETLTLKILKRLNKMSTYSADFLQISNVMGSNSRQVIAKKLAERYVASAALKNVVRKVVGQTDLSSIGEEELGQDLGKEGALFNNPMSASQRSGYRVGQQSSRENLV
jgi:hypothetical protein